MILEHTLLTIFKNPCRSRSRHKHPLSAGEMSQYRYNVINTKQHVHVLNQMYTTCNVY